jgi:hypothetical protein
VRRLLATLSAAVLTAAFLCPLPAAAATRAEQWRAVAQQALDAYEVAPPPPSFQAFSHAYALLAIARLHGWDDPRLPGLVDHLLAERNPDGGWGLGVARDQFGDGSVNPATTTYTVTLAGHVGPALLEAYRHGLVDDQPLRDIVALLMSTSRIDTVAGQCVAFSRAAVDALGATYCVHNVNAGVAAFLTATNAIGIGATGLAKRVSAITKREASAWNTVSSVWPYKDTSTAADPDHNSYEAESMYLLAYPIGREAGFQLLAAPAVNDDGRRAHLRLVALPGGPGSMASDGSGTTMWCVMGDQWLAEAAAYVTASAGDAMRLSQAAALAAADAIACEGA